ncbi:MAG: protein BatD [Gammaproteobacteria bacterium]|nr:protein BatD [Gammaproteobacteria bacterium]
MVIKSNSFLNAAGNVNIRFLQINFFVLLLALPTLVTAATIQVKADRNPVSLNESFQLIYESSESVDDDPDFAPLQKYLDILNRSQSSNISIVNGRYNSSKTWVLNVIARQVGVIVLPPVSFGSDLSDPYKITVKAATKNQLVQSGFYTRIRVDQEQVYAQQQLVITQQLFSDKNLSAYGMAEIDFNGMDVISLPLGDEKKYKTQIGDKAYLVIEKKYAVFPQTSGLLKLAPVLAEARTGSASNSFFNSLGNGKVVRARSNALDIAVLPVPANINVNPWLPAKNFQLLEQWPANPPQFVQSEPVTRTLSIKAEGLTAAQLPVLPDISIDGLKQYPDQPLLNDIQNDTGITGYRVEKIALIPTVSGKITLPAIDIPWWNTTTQKREVASIPARIINVIPSASPVTPAVTPSTVPQAVAAEIEPVESTQSVDLLSSAESKIWMFVAILFAVAWIVTSLSWFFVSRKKRPVNNKEQSALSAKQQYKLLKVTCAKKDVAGVRLSLVNWAQAFFSKSNINNLQDLVQYVPAELSREIKKLDAILYGGQQLEINFDLIIDSIEQLIKSESSKSSQKQPELLEPLYK